MKKLKYFITPLICVLGMINVQAQLTGGGEAYPDLLTNHPDTSAMVMIGVMFC